MAGAHPRPFQEMGLPKALLAGWAWLRGGSENLLHLEKAQTGGGVGNKARGRTDCTMDRIHCKNENSLGRFKIINNPKMVKAEHSVKYGGGLVAK